MKRFVRIAAITLVSLIGTVIVLAGLCVGILGYVVFTPKKLTPIVQSVCDSLVIAPHGVGNVNLTLIHTFPHFGLEIDGLYIVNPQPGAPSDTLLAAPKVYVGVNVQKYLDERTLEVTDVRLPDVVLNAYIGRDGKTNFEIDDLIRLSKDTVEDEDTTALVLPFAVQLRNLELNTRQLSFVDRKDSLDIQGLSLHFRAAAAADSLLSEVAAEIKELTLDWNGLKLDLRGYANMLHMDTIGLALEAETNTWNIQHILRTIPEQYARLIPKEVSVDGDAELHANIEGQYGLKDSTLMPHVAATLTLKKGEAAYAGIDVPVERIEGRVTADIDLSDLNTMEAQIESLDIATGTTSLHVTGKISDIMHDMLLDLRANGKVHIPDFACFIPDAYPVKGEVKKASVAARIRLSDLSNMRLKRGTIHGELSIRDIVLDTDSMDVRMPSAELAFRIPAQGNEKKTTDWLSADLKVKSIDANLVGMGAARMGETDIRLCANDILNSKTICADLDLKGADLDGHYLMTDSTGHVSKALASVQKPDICAYIEYDTRDTTALPNMQASFEMAKLDATMDTIEAHVVHPKGSARFRTTKTKTEPQITAGLTLEHLEAGMGKLIDAKTDYLSIKATAQHSVNRSNVLLEWQPRLRFEIHNAVANTSVLPDPVKVPQIALTYSNKDFTIDTSRVELGRSDFSLAGKIQNIGPWLEDKGLLKANLRFISSHADINQLLDYVSGMGNDEETTANATESKEEKEANPFIVPKGVDLTLNTKIETAYAFGETARNLGGMVTIRDGVLVIEEMGFICKAAKLQLTAMYKTPRRNHIFAGLDYHMTDIHIEELVNLIPQVDTMLPMLRSFKGQANFHLAAETYLTADYQLKYPTCRAACSINAQDLTLLDGETFSKIAKILTFKKSTENKIDSISADISLYKEQINIYPFLISCDKWKGAIGGEHNLDMSFDYHVNLLAPLYIGVGVSGTFDKLKIKPEKCIYAQEFKPARTQVVESQAASVRQMIRNALEAKVK